MAVLKFEQLMNGYLIYDTVNNGYAMAKKRKKEKE